MQGRRSTALEIDWQAGTRPLEVDARIFREDSGVDEGDGAVKAERVNTSPWRSRRGAEGRSCYLSPGTGRKFHSGLPEGSGR